MGQTNLFVAHHESMHRADFDRIGTGWEDTLTGCLAFLLAADDGSREGVARTILKDCYQPVVSVESQYQEGGDRPDLVLGLASGESLLIENKVDAQLGAQQLERYLDVTLKGGRPCLVALIARRHVEVPVAVLANPRYMRPPDRLHWFWTDIYRAIPCPQELLGADHLRRCFLDYLELLGLAPTGLTEDWAGLFIDDPSTIPIRDAFGRRLAGVRAWLVDRGFTNVGDSHTGFQATPSECSRWHGRFLWLTVNPTRTRRHLLDAEASHRLDSEAVRVGLVFDSPTAPPEALRIFEALPRPLVDRNGFEWWPVAPYKMGKRRTRLEFVASLATFLADEPLIEERLTMGCVDAAEALLDV